MYTFFKFLQLNFVLFFTLRFISVWYVCIRTLTYIWLQTVTLTFEAHCFSLQAQPCLFQDLQVYPIPSP